MSEMKKCSKCGNEYPNTDEYFCKHKNYKDGLSCLCLECKKINNAKRRDKKLKNLKRWRDENKERRAEYRKMYYALHGERERKSHKKWLLDNKEKVLAYGRYHKLNNRERYCINEQRRNARKKKLPATFTPEQWERCLEYFEYKDAYTGLPMGTVTQDHFIPLSNGGQYTIDNIIPCDKNINSSKSNNDPFEWYKKQPFFSEKRLKRILKYLRYKHGVQQITLTL